MIHYSCIGATGYVCGEVLRMMVNHPDGELVNVLDTYGVGDAISTHHPALRGFYDQTILDLTEENVRETARKSDVVMIQVPSGAVAKWAEIVLAEGSRIIDIGADIRFRDVKVWEKWYGDKHTNPQMTHDAVYSMPEMNRELAKGKKLIANPGCYPTASTLGLQPMLKTGHIVENTIVIDAKSGFTGAGRRFEKKGSYHGADVYDDYAHHPGELHALLTMAKALPYRRIVCAFQPHTYTRTKALFEEFVRELKLPDVLILAEIYAAREQNDIGISSNDLARRIPGAIYCPTLDKVTEALRAAAQPGDLIITVGAGDIYKAGEKLLREN